MAKLDLKNNHTNSLLSPELPTCLSLAHYLFTLYLLSKSVPCTLLQGFPSLLNYTQMLLNVRVAFLKLRFQLPDGEYHCYFSSVARIKRAENNVRFV